MILKQWKWFINIYVCYETTSPDNPYQSFCNWFHDLNILEVSMYNYLKTQIIFPARTTKEIL